MRQIRKLTKTQLRDALNIAVKAYPMMQISTDKQMEEFETRVLQDFNKNNNVWYGLFEEDKLLGSMVLYDFTMNCYGKDTKARGIGFVAVDFLQKKAKSMQGNAALVTHCNTVSIMRLHNRPFTRLVCRQPRRLPLQNSCSYNLETVFIPRG